MGTTTPSSDISSTETTEHFDIFVDYDDVGTYTYSIFGKILFTVIMPIIFTVGIVGNTSCIYVVARIKSMHSGINIFLVSLAFADLIFLLTTMPRWFVLWQTSPVVDDWTAISPFAMNLTMWFSTTSRQVSVLLISAVTVERYFAICHPMLFRVRRENHNHNTIAIYACAIIWTCSLISLFPSYFIFKKKEFKFSWPPSYSEELPETVVYPIPCLDRGAWCLEYWDWLQAFSPALFLLMVVISIVSYALMVKSLRKSNREALTVAAKKSIKNNTQVVRMLLVTVVCFTVFLVPNQVGSVLGFYANKKSSEVFKFVYRTFFYLNSAINPFIYNFTSSAYREGFKKVFIDPLWGKNSRKIRPVTISDSLDAKEGPTNGMTCTSQSKLHSISSPSHTKTILKSINTSSN